MNSEGAGEWRDQVEHSIRQIVEGHSDSVNELIDLLAPLGFAPKSIQGPMFPSPASRLGWFLNGWTNANVQRQFACDLVASVCPDMEPLGFRDQIDNLLAAIRKEDLRAAQVASPNLRERLPGPAGPEYSEMGIELPPGFPAWVFAGFSDPMPGPLPEHRASVLAAHWCASAAARLVSIDTPGALDALASDVLHCVAELECGDRPRWPLPQPMDTFWDFRSDMCLRGFAALGAGPAKKRLNSQQFHERIWPNAISSAEARVWAALLSSVERHRGTAFA